MPFTGIKNHQLTTDVTYPRWFKFLINTSTINGFLEYDSDSKPVWTTENSQIVKIKSFMNATTNPDRLSELDFSADLSTLFENYDRVFAKYTPQLKTSPNVWNKNQDSLKMSIHKSCWLRYIMN
jgi:hypothetical protein